MIDERRDRFNDVGQWQHGNREEAAEATQTEPFFASKPSMAATCFR